VQDDVDVSKHVGLLTNIIATYMLCCWPLVPKFVGSYLAEAVGFLRAKKSSARLPSEGK